MTPADGLSPDPDPLNPRDVDHAYASGYVEGWDDAERANGTWLTALVLGLVIGAVLSGVIAFAWAITVHAAPRSGQTTERVDASTCPRPRPLP